MSPWLRPHRGNTAGGPWKGGVRIDVGQSTARSAARDAGEGSTVVLVRLMARARAPRIELDSEDRLEELHGSARLHREGDATADTGSATRERTQARQQPLDQNSESETHPIALCRVRGHGAARSSGPAWMECLEGARGTNARLTRGLSGVNHGVQKGRDSGHRGADRTCRLLGRHPQTLQEPANKPLRAMARFDSRAAEIPEPVDIAVKDRVHPLGPEANRPWRRPQHRSGLITTLTRAADGTPRWPPAWASSSIVPARAAPIGTRGQRPSRGCPSDDTRSSRAGFGRSRGLWASSRRMDGGRLDRADRRRRKGPWEARRRRRAGAPTARSGRRWVAFRVLSDLEQRQSAPIWHPGAVDPAESSARTAGRMLREIGHWLSAVATSDPN
jgi:hypothetical protein